MPKDPIAELDQLLCEERDALRKLDSVRVLACARRKQALVEELRGPDGSVPVDVLARLRALVPALERNGILLAHARDILRDALSAACPELGAAVAARNGKSCPTARLLSVRG
ncbi:MAG: hypothetical protein ABTD50_15080 [Polyangiaceae bacterium]|jgi:hypothetical protein